MTVRTLTATFLAVNLAVLLPPVTSGAATGPRAAGETGGGPVPAYQRFLSPASPLELVAAKTVDRVAWTAFEEGKRNAYTAAAPAFKPVRLTNFMTDNGTDLSGIRISDDGSTVVFIRGTAPNRDGWVANPTRGPGRSRARGLGGAHRRRRRPGASCATRPTPSSRPTAARSSSSKKGRSTGRRVTPTPPGERAGSRREAVHHPVGRAERSEVVARRPQDRVRQHAHRSQLHHGLRRRDADGEVHVAERRLRHEPALDGRQQERRLRAPARVSPFGQQAQQGGGGIGIPNGPAFQPNAEAGRGGRGRGNAGPGQCRRPWRRRRPAVRHQSRNIPGLSQATFRGGYNLSVWKADVVDRRSERGLAQPAERSPVHELRQPASGGRSPDRSVQRRRRWPRRARRAGAGAAAGPGRRVGALLLDQPGDAERAAGPADDDRRPHRGPDVGRALG